MIPIKKDRVIKKGDMMQNVVSLSGGKDSTAMLHMMVERGEKIHSAVFFDTGWEFPGMKEHIEQIRRNLPEVKIIILKPKKPFNYWLLERPIVAKKGNRKGEVHRIGNGWPSPMRRWCTREKVNSINRYLKDIDNPISCIGYAFDEQHRDKNNNGKIKKRYPLIEYGITENEALNYCYSLGYKWNGLYEIFHRVSCFCCPLQRLGELHKVRKHFPSLWGKMLEWEKIGDTGTFLGFRGYDSVHDLERRFARKDKQLTFSFMEQPGKY